MSVLMINDIDAGLGRFGKLYFLTWMYESTLVGFFYLFSFHQASLWSK